MFFLLHSPHTWSNGDDQELVDVGRTTIILRLRAVSVLHSPAFLLPSFLELSENERRLPFFVIYPENHLPYPARTCSKKGRDDRQIRFAMRTLADANTEKGRNNPKL